MAGWNRGRSGGPSWSVFLAGIVATTIFCQNILLVPSIRAAEIQVSVQDFSFSPREVVIDPGDSVRWINEGGFHNVDADDGSFTSGDPSSAAWQLLVTFDEPGDNPYHCDVHGAPGGSGMSGSVTVRLFGDDFESGTTEAWGRSVGGI